MAMRAVVLAIALLWSVAGAAQSLSNGAPAPAAGVQSTNAIQTCGPVSGTLTAAGQSVTLNCLGAANFLISITTPSGQSPLVGTLSSSDPTTGGSRRLLKTGSSQLQTATDVLPGTQGNLEYRTVGGGYGQSVTLSSYTSGQATITILGLYNTTTTFLNGSVDDRQDVAARQGRLYTATTGIQSVAAGNYLALQFSIPSTATYRANIVERILDCNVTGTTVVQFNGASNPTTNLATTAATISNRGITGGLASQAAITYSMATTHPDTSPATTNPAGGFIRAGGPPAVLSKSYERLVAPGQSFTNWIGGSGGGLTAAAICYITYLWFEEPLQ